jgi:hypothetical protein
MSPACVQICCNQARGQDGRDARGRLLSRYLYLIMELLGDAFRNTWLFAGNYFKLLTWIEGNWSRDEMVCASPDSESSHKAIYHGTCAVYIHPHAGLLSRGSLRALNPGLELHPNETH